MEGGTIGRSTSFQVACWMELLGQEVVSAGRKVHANNCTGRADSPRSVCRARTGGTFVSQRFVVDSVGSCVDLSVHRACIRLVSCSDRVILRALSYVSFSDVFVFAEFVLWACESCRLHRKTLVRK